MDVIGKKIEKIYVQKSSFTSVMLLLAKNFFMVRFTTSASSSTFNASTSIDEPESKLTCSFTIKKSVHFNYTSVISTNHNVHSSLVLTGFSCLRGGIAFLLFVDKFVGLYRLESPSRH